MLATAIAVAFSATAIAAGHAVVSGERPAAAKRPQAQPAKPVVHNPFDAVDRLAKAPRPAIDAPTAPGDLAKGRIPGLRMGNARADVKPSVEQAEAEKQSGDAAAVPGTKVDGGVPCTLDGITGFTPERFADFLEDPRVSADGCLGDVLWTWDQRLVPIMSKGHVQAVARRAQRLAAQHDGLNGSHLLEMFTYLHAVAFHDFARDELDLEDKDTVESVRQAVEGFSIAARTFDVTRANAETLREALYAASVPGAREHQIPLIKRVLATMDADPSHRETAQDSAWGGAVLAALSVGYLGVYSGNNDTGFQNAAAADPSYRAALKAFATYTHLKNTENSWAVRDALNEYGRLGEIKDLKDEIVTALGALLTTTARDFGQGGEVWGKVVTWLNKFDACKPYNVCKADIERSLLPKTYIYDNGSIKVRTALDRATVDRLYYASKQVKAQFHRVLGTDRPLDNDTNANLNIVLYSSRSDYRIYHPLLTGMKTDNGGIYIEEGATFYTFERRVPEESTLTLEELFRHEYTHYLNGRFAIPGFFGEGPWYQGDRTTAMDEGTAEFFAGATSVAGIQVRKSLVQSIIDDTVGGKPRMTIDQLLHAQYERDGFRFYSYAGTFFEYLWNERPALIKEMYSYARANDVAGFDAWRKRLGEDSGLQRSYDAFLDKQSASVAKLYVPNTNFTDVHQLKEDSADAVRASFSDVTGTTPDCKSGGSSDRPRFICTGRVSANLTNPRDSDLVFKDMSKTVDYFILERAKKGANNLANMNCSFGKVELWGERPVGTADYSCEGPLKN
ncbi:collagenase [Streptomyces sp. NPDC056254]|uniref:collagenase n=1 Tax=Streptomyces sp. NPDC056254 TaxID=3345763 RepID=UPI0035DC7AF9